MALYGAGAEDRFKKVQPWRLRYSRLLEDSNFKYVSGLTNKYELHLVFASVCAFIILPTGDSCCTYWFCCMKGCPLFIDSLIRLTTGSLVSSGSICLQRIPTAVYFRVFRFKHTIRACCTYKFNNCEGTQFRKAVSTSI